MKLLNIILSVALSLSTTQSFANKHTSSSLGAKEILAQQYAELEDLKNQVKRAQNIKELGTVIIVLSTVAVTTGVLMDILYTFEGIRFGVVSISFGKLTKPVHIPLDQLLYVGGATSMVGSSILVMLKEDQLAELQKQIEVLQEKMQTTYAELN